MLTSGAQRIPILLALTLALTTVCLCPTSATGLGASIDELDPQQRGHQQQLQEHALLSAAQPALGTDTGPVANDVIAIREGADLDLSCPIIVKNEDMVISWTCDDEPANIRSSRIHVTDSGKLRIHSSKVGDSCNYRCEAADGHGALSVIIKVIIVDQRLMEELSRRANLAGGIQSSLRTVNETMASLATPGAGAPRKRLIGGVSLQNKRESSQALTGGKRYPSLPLAATTRHQELDSEIEMQIEPAQVDVHKNKTFSLECRIKHAPHLLAPQIIWLKEFMGAPVGSLKEAMDKNLIYLDGVYYHSLNWPRAITYSNKSSTASSALLVRQSSYLHSGRYACFAGYPSSVMTLDHSNSLLSSQVGNSMSETALVSTATSNRPPLKYKLAQALVRVDDKEGEERHRESLVSLDLRSSRQSLGAPASVLMGVLSTNTWQRNVTIGLLTLCSSLLLVKIVLIARDRTRNKSPPKHVAMVEEADATGGETPEPRLPLSGSARLSGGLGPPAAERSENESHLLGSHLPDIFQRERFGEVPSNSLIGGGNLLKDTYKIDQELLNERLNEHVYSEIGSSTTVPKTVEPYYKRPNKNNI